MSRQSGNADINAPQSALPALALARSPLESQHRHRGRSGDMSAGDRCQGAGQGSHRSSGPKPLLAEQGKGNAEIALLWFFTTWFRGMFDTLLWPILGVVFLPTTLLWYTAVHHWFGGQWSLWPIIGLVVALLIDISPAGGRRRPKPA